MHLLYMPVQFHHLRARYYDADPGPARALVGYHLRQQEIAGLIATETSHPAGFTIPSHAHDLHSFYFVLSGTLTEYADRSRQELDTAALMFTPAGHIHANTFHAAGGRCFLVELTSAWAGHLAAASMVPGEPRLANDGESSRLALRLYREFQGLDAVSPLAAEGLTLEILAALARVGEPSAALPSWLHLVRDLLHDRYAERITLAELARESGVHPAQLVRAFRRRFRHSPGEYQRRIRIDHATRQLATTRRPLASIALAAGFADQAHFCRTIKRHTGLTPAQYRARFAIG
jgi:AraC family transcriptional regulator